MSDIVTRNEQTGIVKSDDDNPYVAYGESAARTRIIGKLLKFNKFGEWVAGEEAKEITEDARLMIDMEEFYVGWIKWEDSRPTEQVMGRVLDGFTPPRRSELGDTEREYWPADSSGSPRDPWQFSNYLVMMDMETRELYTYATASRGGLQAIGKLSTSYGKRMRHRPNQFPIVTLQVSSYEHPNKQFGTIKIPVLSIAGWGGRAKIDEMMEMKDAGGELSPDHEEEEAKQAPPVRSVPRPQPGDYTAKPPAKNGPTAAKLPKPRF
jgi:hypothetical protein